MSKPKSDDRANVANAIRELGCNAQNICTNEDPSTIEWIDVPIDFTPPSNEDILAKVAELKVIYDNLQYQRDRESEYPSMADQLDYIYHNGIAKWKSDMVKPVKDAHPKPE